MRVFLKFFLLAIIIFGIHASSKYPIPRFVSLRSNAVNLHVGPGSQYPVDWRYIRSHLPLEVIAEFDNWRFVRDITGTQGWIHQNLLTGRRFVMVTNNTQILHAKPDEKSSVIARLEPGVIAKVLECDAKYCKVKISSNTGQNYHGWLNRQAIWGVYPNETKF